MNNLNTKTDLHAFIHQYSSEDAMIEEVSKDPKHLIQLFECVSNKKNHWHVTNTNSFNKIFKKIETLDAEGKLNIDQIQKIIYINETIYPSITDSALKAENNIFFSNHLKNDNIYDRLEHAVNIKADDYVRKCLDYIEQKTGTTFSVNDTLLTIDVSSPKISMEELAMRVGKLANIFNNQISINLQPEKSSNLTSLETFIKGHGEFITSLDLKNLGNSIDDSFTSLTIKSCPNFTSLIISSDKITGEGLKELSSLQKLKTLDLRGCYSLTALPKLPELLSTLNLIMCYGLTELPDLPKVLNTFKLTGSKNLTTLPALPAALSTLHLSDCPNLKELPDLPAALKTLSLIRCRSVTSLPILPAALSKLLLSDCGSLTGKSLLLTLAKVFDQNFDQGLTLYKSFEIEEDKLIKLIAKQLIGQIESEDYKPIFVEALRKKISAQTTHSSTQKLLAEFLLYHEESLFEYERLSDLKKVFERNFDEGLSSYKSFRIKDTDRLFKLIAEQLLGKIDSKDYRPIFFEALAKKLSDQTIHPSTKELLVQLILDQSFTEELRLSVLAKVFDRNFDQGLTLYRSFKKSFYLTEELRLSVLAKVFDHNFDEGLSSYESFEIEEDKLFKLIAEQLIGKIESNDYKPFLFKALEIRLTDPSTPPSTQKLLAQFILDKQESLKLHDEHPLIQEATMVISAFSIEGENNPLSIFKKLNELAKTPSEFSPSAMTVEGTQVAINMDRLVKLSKAAIIKRDALPKNVTREVFETLANDLKNKCEDNEEATKALENLGTTWATISTPIFGDPSQQLAGLLDLSGENVSDSEAKWKAVLAWILDKESVPKDNTFFTEQEETFIKVMMGIQNCKGGKDMGIALTYEWLEPKYQYQLALSKPATTILGEQQEIERNEAIMFLNENLVKNQNLNISQDFIKDFGTKNLKAVYPLVYGEEFWDEDDNFDLHLNDKGAVEILTALNEAKEHENLPVKQFIGAAIRKLVARQFTGTNALMKTIMDLNLNKAEQEELLTAKLDVVDDDMLKNLKDEKTVNISEGAHYSIYLGNLIGHLVGARSNVTFDRNTGVLKARLLDKTREEVLETFFQFVTPKRFVDEIVKVVNVNPGENKELLKPYLSDDMYGADGHLSRKGALSLLEKLGYLEKQQ